MSIQENPSWRALSLEFDEEMRQVLLQQHHAAQFIALIGRHLIRRKEDDSNTSMQYLGDREWIIGNKLSRGLRIALDLADLKLIIIDNNFNWLSEFELVKKKRSRCSCF